MPYVSLGRFLGIYRLDPAGIFWGMKADSGGVFELGLEGVGGGIP
jgi:hypothetical protein